MFCVQFLVSTRASNQCSLDEKENYCKDKFLFFLYFYVLWWNKLRVCIHNFAGYSYKILQFIIIISMQHQLHMSMNINVEKNSDDVSDDPHHQVK